jgi:hypothetical protein
VHIRIQKEKDAKYQGQTDAWMAEETANGARVEQEQADREAAKDAAYIGKIRGWMNMSAVEKERVEAEWARRATENERVYVERCVCVL